MRSLLILLLTTAPVLAQTAEPSSTTATYGNWTVTCATVSAEGATAAQKTCQMTTKLNLKDADGQLRPLLEVAIGQPLGGEGARIVVQVPLDVALRQPLIVSVDADASQTPKPQTELVSASYFACVPQGCIADAALTADVIATLQQSATTNLTFTALAGSKRITVPVAMTGFGDAWAALGLPSR
jgi:invasion protein IalB